MSLQGLEDLLFQSMNMCDLIMCGLRIITRNVSSLICNTSARHERHECNTSATLATRVRHECYNNDTNAIRVLHERHELKMLNLITTRVKTYFHTLIFTIREEKDYEEKDNFFPRITFWKCLFSMPKCV